MPKLTIDIGATIAGLNKGITAARAKIGKFFKDIRGGLNTAIGGIGSLLTMGGAARLFSGVIDTMDQIGKSARALGMSAEGYQKIFYAARRANMPQDRLNMSFQRMANFLQRVNEGGAKEEQILKRLNLNYRELIKMKPDQQFIRIGNAIDQVNNATERLALANKIYGRGARDVLNMVRGYDIAANQLSATGGIISAEDIKAAEDYKDQVETAKTAWMAAVSRGGQAQHFAEALSYYNDGLEQSSKHKGMVGKLGSHMAGILGAIIGPFVDDTGNRMKNAGFGQGTKGSKELRDFIKKRREAGVLPPKLSTPLGGRLGQRSADAFHSVGGYLTPGNAKMGGSGNPVEEIAMDFKEMLQLVRQIGPEHIVPTTEKKIEGGT